MDKFSHKAGFLGWQTMNQRRKLVEAIWGEDFGNLNYGGVTAALENFAKLAFSRRHCFQYKISDGDFLT
jgi:hypothetical protein